MSVGPLAGGGHPGEIVSSNDMVWYMDRLPFREK